MKTAPIKTALALALLALPLVGAPLASADTGPAQAARAKTISVSRADLDLTQPGDAAILLARAETAARGWCVQPGSQSRGTTASCMRKVMADLIRRLDEPAVTTAWQTRGDTPIRLASN